MLTVPSTASSDFKVAAAGDISCPVDQTERHSIPDGEEPPPEEIRCQGRQIADMIASQNPLFALAVGDLIQGQESYPGAYDDFQRAWGEPLGPKIISTLGNHDYYRGEDGLLTADGYFGYWQNQNVPAWRYGKPGKGWSSWNAGKWHMVNLNSNCNIVDCTFTGEQMRWLINDLKKDRQNPETQCTLAYFHHPRFSAGIPGGRTGDASLVANMWEILYRYRTDLIVTGHQHFYERYLPQNPSGEQDPTGMTQIIAGTGGASTFRTEDEEGRPAANSAVAIRGLGAAFLDLGDSSYRTSFRDRLGYLHDVSAPRRCLDPHAGQEQRTPRAQRYTAHMKRMANLNRRINTLKRNIRKLSKKKASPHWIRELREKRIDLIKTRNKVTTSRLY